MEASQANSPAEFLKARLLRRVANNSSYSVRAFARDLKISHSYLSQILNERRKLSVRQALLLSDALKLDEVAKQHLLHLLLENRARQLQPTPSTNTFNEDSTIALDMDRFRTVKEWYHGAIVELTTLKKFRAEYQWIARQLAITPLQVRSAVNRLRRLEVLKTTGRKWTKTRRRFHFPTTSAQEAVAGFHREMIFKALSTLDKRTAADFARRDITGITVAIDPMRIPEARRRIQKFRNQLADYLSKGKPSEVYQLNVQLFALTRTTKQVPPKKASTSALRR